tara:strand:+ start:176 stop:412 length:237 start_codon:yes stop_codon:yes gene_type:complete
MTLDIQAVLAIRSTVECADGSIVENARFCVVDGQPVYVTADDELLTGERKALRHMSTVVIAGAREWGAWAAAYQEALK